MRQIFLQTLLIFICAFSVVGAAVTLNSSSPSVGEVSNFDEVSPPLVSDGPINIIDQMIDSQLSTSRVGGGAFGVCDLTFSGTPETFTDTVVNLPIGNLNSDNTNLSHQMRSALEDLDRHLNMLQNPTPQDASTHFKLGVLYPDREVLWKYGIDYFMHIEPYSIPGARSQHWGFVIEAVRPLNCENCFVRLGLLYTTSLGNNAWVYICSNLLNFINTGARIIFDPLGGGVIIGNSSDGVDQTNGAARSGTQPQITDGFGSGGTSVNLAPPIQQSFVSRAASKSGGCSLRRE